MSPTLSAMRAISQSRSVRAELVRLRHSLGITQDDLAAQVGRRRETVNRWETGKTDPTVVEFFIWCSVLGCDIKVTASVTQ